MVLPPSNQTMADRAVHDGPTSVQRVFVSSATHISKAQEEHSACMRICAFPACISSCLPCPNEHRPTSLHVQCSTLSALATSVSALCAHIRHDYLGYSFVTASLTDLIDLGGLLMFFLN